MDWLLIRMAIWLRKPPSRSFILAAIAAVVLAATVFSLEMIGLWPDWAVAERVNRRGPAVEVTPVE